MCRYVRDCLNTHTNFSLRKRKKKEEKGEEKKIFKRPDNIVTQRPDQLKVTTFTCKILTLLQRKYHQLHNNMFLSRV